MIYDVDVDENGPFICNGIDPTEDKIKLLLVMRGYEQNEIRFRGEETRYIMYGYWNYINPNDLDYVSEHTNIYFEIIEWDDSDCGWLFSYHIKKEVSDELE